MSETNKMHIGFVILVWNSEKVIQKCAESIVKLKMIIPTAVIVDNGSKDQTLEIVNGFQSRYPDIFTTICFTENRGTTISRNMAIKQLLSTKQDYICILDSDTIINDDAFLKMDNEMSRHPEYGIIGPAMVTSSGILQMSARCFPTAIEKILKAIPSKILQEKGERIEEQKPNDPNEQSYPVDYLMSACWLVRPSVFTTAGFLDESIFYAPEDAEYCIRVWKSGYVVAFCPEARIIHEWQRLSKRKLISKMNWEHIKGLAYMFNKHHYVISTRRLRKTFKQGEE